MEDVDAVVPGTLSDCGVAAVDLCELRLYDSCGRTRQKHTTTGCERGVPSRAGSESDGPLPFVRLTGR